MILIKIILFQIAQIVNNSEIIIIVFQSIFYDSRSFYTIYHFVLQLSLRNVCQFNTVAFIHRKAYIRIMGIHKITDTQSIGFLLSKISLGLSTPEMQKLDEKISPSRYHEKAPQLLHCFPVE